MTPAERIIWYALRAHRLNGAGFRRQAPIGPYIADFVSHAAKLIIEIDGGQHFEDGHERRDAVRDAFLNGRGIPRAAFRQSPGGDESPWSAEPNRRGAWRGRPLPTLPRKRERGRGCGEWKREWQRTDEIHPLLAEGASGDAGGARHDRGHPHHDRPRGRARRGQGQGAGAIHHRAGGFGRAASQCGPAARLHGGYRVGRAGAGGVRGAQCARRPRRRVRGAGRGHSGQERHAQRRHHPGRGKPRHAVLGLRAAALRRSRGHHRAAGRRAGRQALCGNGPASPIR